MHLKQVTGNLVWSNVDGNDLVAKALDYAVKERDDSPGVVEALQTKVERLTRILGAVLDTLPASKALEVSTIGWDWDLFPDFDR